MPDQPSPVKERIAIIGLGKVGTAVGFLLRQAGCSIVAVSDQSPAALSQGVTYTGGRSFTNPSDAAAEADCIMITTVDDAIQAVCKKITSDGACGEGSRVIHMSGAGSLDLLDAAKRRGASVASIHPIQSFADVDGAISNLPGSTFGITAEEHMKDWCIRFVQNLQGIPFFVSEMDKPIYHAAACMASNYLATLLHLAEMMYQSIGLNHEESLRAFWPVVRGTLKNVETRGTVDALTGPIARGDMGTVRMHLNALREKLPDFLDIYCLLGLATIDLAEKKGLSEQQAQKLRTLLQGGSKR